jgi:hypothetical protein
LKVSAVCWRITIVGKTMGESVRINESGHDKEEDQPVD